MTDKQQTINSFDKRTEELIKKSTGQLPQWTDADLKAARCLLAEYFYQLEFIARLEKALSRRV